MKKFLFVLVAGIILTFFSCSRDASDQTKTEHEVNLITDIQNKVVKGPEAMHDLQKGYLDIWVTDDNELVVLNEVEEKNKFLILQRGKSSEFDKSLKSGNYEILYLDGSVILKNTENNNLTHIFVPNEHNVEQRKRIEDLNIDFKNVFEGYGLILNNVDKQKITFKPNELKSAVSIVGLISEKFHSTGNHMKSSECPNGGPGATSCTKGDCSVTCSSPYYACCGDTCTCKSPYNNELPGGGS